MSNRPAVVSRTGYTGEDGFELIVGKGSARLVWEALMEAGKPGGIQACGLGGARHAPARGGDAALRP